MNLKNNFCRSVDLATFMPPLTKIPGSAPAAQAVLWTTMVLYNISRSSPVLRIFSPDPCHPTPPRSSPVLTDLLKSLRF